MHEVPPARDHLVSAKRRHRDRFQQGAGIGAHREAAAMQVDQHPLLVMRFALRRNDMGCHSADRLLDDIHRIEFTHLRDHLGKHGLKAAANQCDVEVGWRRSPRYPATHRLSGSRLRTGELRWRQFKGGNVHRSILAERGRILLVHDYLSKHFSALPSDTRSEERRHSAQPQRDGSRRTFTTPSERASKSAYAAAPSVSGSSWVNSRSMAATSSRPFSMSRNNVGI
jgi:hypothetical protein